MTVEPLHSSTAGSSRFAKQKIVPPKVRYADRLGRVDAFVHAHLDEDLPADRLAEIAAMSPFH